MNRFLLAVVGLVHYSFAQAPTPSGVVDPLPKSDVILQGFYWNSPPGGVWYDSLRKLAPRLASAGFGATWFPPPTKGAGGGFSMGYDPYDHFDFGEFNQKGSSETRFGSRQELISAIGLFHTLGIKVFADAVMGHMNGAEQKIPYECKPYPQFPDSAYLLFNYPSGSGRFRKNARHFYPNNMTCDVNPPYHGPSDPAFKFGENLAHAQSHVKDSLIVWGHYLRNVLGFDGFRIDAAKHIDPIFVGPWLQAVDTNGFAFAEYYGSTSEIASWHHYCQNVFGGKVSMLDFPLRFSLREMCNNTTGFFDMTSIDNAGLINSGFSGFDVVTFVENHDFDRIGWDGSIDIGHAPVLFDKHLAYAYILFSEGRPCVFFKDYFDYGLSGQIDTLIRIRQNFLGGSTTKRSGLNPYYIREDGYQNQSALAGDIYLARRNGAGAQRGGYLLINDESDKWIDVWVDTEEPIGIVYRDYTGKDADKVVVGPAPGGSKNRVKLWCPPRSYTIYVADTTVHLNHPPFVSPIPAQYAFLHTPFELQITAGDPNSDPLSYSLSGNPAWLSINSTGLLSGTPEVGELGSFSVTVNVSDPSQDTTSTTFTLSVVDYPILDGSFEGASIWGSPIAIADTLPGWDGARARELYVTSDPNYYYFGARVRARQWMNWAFIINTKWGGSSSESWSRSIIYDHPNKPDYVLRGTFSGHAEFHTWNGVSWSGVGSPLSSANYAEGISSDALEEGWIEARILRSALGNPGTFGVQFYLTGSQNSHATFDACPNDQNTTAWSGITTRLKNYAFTGQRAISQCNLQHPPSASFSVGGSVTVYARVFGLGITDSIGVGSNLQAWIGYSGSNSNPSFWSEWIPASFNLDVNGNDEFRADIGASLSSGTYFYASRFQYENGPFFIGGYSSTGGGFWDSVNNRSGTLVITGPPAVPSLMSPSDGDPNRSSITTLVWSAVSNATKYHVQVSSTSEFVDIVFEDTGVTQAFREVRGLLVGSEYHWRVRAANSYGSSLFTDSWRFGVNKRAEFYGIRQGWNMLSLPLDVVDPRPSAVYPGTSSPAFRYGDDLVYSSVESLSVGTGYWLRASAPESVLIIGNSITMDTIPLNTGWNLIGSLSDPISVHGVSTIPDSIIQSAFFHYDGSYGISSTIQPGRAHWIKSRSAGTLVLSSSGSVKKVSTGVDNLNELNRLTARDANGSQQILYFTSHAHLVDKILGVQELPPIPAGESFDVRFGENRLVLIVSDGTSSRVPVEISHANYPLRLGWKVLPTDRDAVLMVGAEHIRLDRDGEKVIEDASQNISIGHLLSSTQQTPLVFSLRQNYPNPFNPSTVMEFVLPVTSDVDIRLYGVLGEEITTILRDERPAGGWKVPWNGLSQSGSPVPSGVYFVVFRATGKDEGSTSFNAIRKLILMR